MINDIDAILKTKRAIYGDNSLEEIAEYWSTYLNRKITMSDVCIMMVMMKVARLDKTCSGGTPSATQDSITDIYGYTRLLEKLKSDENK